MYFKLFQLVRKDIIFKNIMIELSLYLVNSTALSFYFGYFKIFMEKYYFSPFKICYLVGIINSPIILIVYFIFSYLPCEKSHFCYIKYNNKYYFDNFYSYFTNNKISKIFLNLFYNIFDSLYGFIFNITIQSYPFCYTFFPEKINEFIYDLIEIFKNKRNIKGNSFLIIIYIFELLSILMLMEIIELKFCGLNKYFKRNIYKRALLEMSDNPDINEKGFELEGDYIVNFENDKRKTKNDKEIKKIELGNL